MFDVKFMIYDLLKSFAYCGSEHFSDNNLLASVVLPHCIAAFMNATYISSLVCAVIFCIIPCSSDDGFHSERECVRRYIFVGVYVGFTYLLYV